MMPYYMSNDEYPYETRVGLGLVSAIFNMVSVEVAGEEYQELRDKWAEELLTNGSVKLPNGTNIERKATS